MQQRVLLTEGSVVFAVGVHVGGFPGLSSSGRTLLFSSYTYEKGTCQRLLHLLQEFVVVIHSSTFMMSKPRPHKNP